jgi:hypothetical protein
LRFCPTPVQLCPASASVHRSEYRRIIWKTALTKLRTARPRNGDCLASRRSRGALAAEAQLLDRGYRGAEVVTGARWKRCRIPGFSERFQEDVAAGHARHRVVLANDAIRTATGTFQRSLQQGDAAAVRLCRSETEGDGKAKPIGRRSAVYTHPRWLGPPPWPEAEPATLDRVLDPADGIFRWRVRGGPCDW